MNAKEKKQNKGAPKKMRAHYRLKINKKTQTKQNTQTCKTPSCILSSVIVIQIYGLTNVHLQ